MKIGFIGTGNMGGAIIRGYAASASSAGIELLICNRTEIRNRQVAEDIAKAGHVAEICGSPGELAEKADIIIIGVKPQGVPDVLREIAPILSEAAGSKLIISMAAGISIAAMENALGINGESADSGDAEHAIAGQGIIRIMPNTPAQVGEAMTSISRNSAVTEEDMTAAKAIFNSIGRCEEVAEDMIDCVIGVSGSSPAYTYMYIEALAQAAVNNGMEKKKARAFAAQAVLGAAKMALESGETLEQLRINVCSPKGTTIEAVNRLLENGFMEKAQEGFQAAVNRSKEMNRNN